MNQQDAIREIVSRAPPLTSEQRRRLRALLLGRGHDPREVEENIAVIERSRALPERDFGISDEEDNSDEVSKSFTRREKLSRAGPRSGFVYFVGAEGGHSIKIGAFTNVESRLSSLNSASPVRLVILASFASLDMYVDESSLHKRFQHLRLNGEWFIADSDIWQIVDRVNNGDFSWRR